VAVDPVELLSGALRIYSPTGSEGKLAAYLCSRMKELGYERVRLDEAGNALGEAGDGRRRLLLCGHIDTVPGELPFRESGGYLYGRGAADAKSPLCALLTAGARAAESGLRVTFAGAVCEEGDGLGIQTLIKSGRRYDFAVFGEPSGADRLTVGYRGRVGMNLSLSTAGGHAASPWAHVSALDELYSVMDALRKLEGESRDGNHFRSISVSPTLVRAGTYHNVIPPNCDSTFDIRIPPGTSSARAIKTVQAIVKRSVKGSTGIKIEFGEATEPYEVDPNSILCRAFQRAVITRLRRKPVLVRKTGTGDMNTLAAAMRVQCVTYGPGESERSHTDSEAVSVRDYLDSIEVLTEAIKQISALSDRAG
jgi:LysW-gamma-L-lysine carboxypeptidase